MLRASSRKQKLVIDEPFVVGRGTTPDGGVPDGGALRRYAVAIVSRGSDVHDARRALFDRVGPRRTTEAASIAASFDGINRVADATGILLDQPPKASAVLAERLGIVASHGSGIAALASERR